MRRARRRKGYHLLPAALLLLAFGSLLFAYLPMLGVDADADQEASTHPVTHQGASTAPAATQPPTNSATAHHHRASHGTNVYASILPGGFSPAVRGVPERVYVPNSESGTVTEINPATFRIIRTFPTGTYDQHITPGWNLHWLYVNNTTSNTLTVLNPRTGRKVRTIPVTDPYNLYFTPDGTKAIVVAESLQRVDFRNPHTWRLVKSVPIPSAGPDHLDFTANGNAFLISCEFTGAVYRVNDQSMRVTGRVDVGGLPVDVKLSPDGTTFYVANQGKSGVTMISARTLRIVGFIHTGDGAHGFAISRDTRNLYVANRLAGTISVISFRTHGVIHTWHVGGSPDMLQVSPNGRQLWTSNRYDASVSVINTRTGHVIERIAVGSSPHGLTYFPQPGAYSVGHNGVYR
jgi:YVTN family beta-propeller protein